MHKLCSDMIRRDSMPARKEVSFRIFLLVSIVLTATLACGTSGEVATPPPATATATPVSEPQLEYTAGDHALSLTHDGTERTYVLHIPPGLDPSQPVPLVLAFHGVGLNASEMMRISGFNAQSDASGFIVVYPEGTGETKSWNGGHCCGTAARDNEESLLINRLVDTK
jgi:polyhydroxybutyrate depolymerase